jgi:hypothetical protein
LLREEDIHVLHMHCAWSAKTAEAAGLVSGRLTCASSIVAHHKLCKDEIFQDLGCGQPKEG